MPEDIISTGQQFETPIDNGQVPPVDSAVVAPVVDGQAGADMEGSTPPEKKGEESVTPPAGQDEAEVVKGDVTPPVVEGNEYGSWEKQYKELRSKQSTYGDQINSIKKEKEEVEAKATEYANWIKQWGPVLEAVVGDDADPELKNKLLQKVQTKPITAETIAEVAAETYRKEEARRAAEREAEETAKAQDAALESFRNKHGISQKPKVLTEVLKIVQEKNFPLNEAGYEAAWLLLNNNTISNNQPNNQVQEKIVDNAMLTGAAPSGGAGEVSGAYHFNLNKVRMP